MKEERGMKHARNVETKASERRSGENVEHYAPLVDLHPDGAS